MALFCNSPRRHNDPAELYDNSCRLAPADLAKQFKRAKPADVLEILKTLETLGRARRAGEGKFRL
jgi:hypothetical protein